MKKSFSSIVTLLLIVVMLFGVVAPTVASAEGTTGNESSSNPSTEDSGSLDTGWCKIEYDKEHLTVTVYPEAEAFAGINKQQMLDMVATLVEAAKNMVLNDLEDNFRNEGLGDGTDPGAGLNADTLWSIAIDGYISNLDASISSKPTEQERYIEFFRQSLSNESLFDGLVTHVAGLMKNAVRFDRVTVEELEQIDIASVQSTIQDILREKVEYVLENYVSLYIDWLTSDAASPSAELDADVKAFIDNKIVDHMKTVAHHFVEGNLDHDTISDIINTYVENEIASHTKDVIIDFASGISTGDVDNDIILDNEIDSIVAQSIANYIDVREGTTQEKSHLYDDIDNEVVKAIKQIVKDDTGITDENNPEFIQAFNTAYGSISEISSRLNAPENVATIKSLLMSKLAGYNSLSSEEQAEVDEDIHTIVNKVLDDHRFDDLFNEYIDDVLADTNSAIQTLRDLVKNEDNNDILLIKNEINSKLAQYIDLTTPPAEDGQSDVRDSIIQIVFGNSLTYRQFNEKVTQYIDSLCAAYTATLDEVKNNGVEEITPTELLECLNSIVINQTQIYGMFGSSVKEFNTEAVISILRELPRPEDIKDFTDEQMKLVYDVYISTTYGNFDFDITLAIGGNYDNIRRLAGLFNEYIYYTLTPDNVLVLDINVPAKFSSAVLKACNTNKIPDSIKNKVFAALSKDADDFYALYKDFTFDEMIELLENVNFEGVLDSNFVSKYVDLSHLSNEEIIEKVSQYEGYFNRILKYAKSAFQRIPASYRSKTVMDLYRGNGKFAFDESRSVNLETLLTKVSSKYGPFIASFLDNPVISGGIDFDIQFDKINRVEYKVQSGNETVVIAEGFLPVGADLNYFAGVSSYEGHNILAWLDETGANLTKMPDKDTTLTAVLDRDYTVIPSANISAVYDENTQHNVGVSVSGGTQNAVYTYKWYKDDVLVSTLTASSFNVKNVADSGTYKCEVSVVDQDGLINKTFTVSITVSITKKGITVPTVSWNGTNFSHNGTQYEVFVTSQLPNNVVIDRYSGTTQAADINTDGYVVTVHFKTTDENYEIISGAEQSHTWYIASDYILLPSNVAWNYEGPFTYDGTAKSVALLNTEQLAGLGIGFRYITDAPYANTATGAGDYVAKVEFYSLIQGKVISGSVADLSWKINKQTIDPQQLVWSGTNLSYTGTEQSVNIVISSNILTATYTGNKGTVVGDYTATAALTLVDTANYALSGNTATHSWHIAKRVVNLSTITWNYVPDGISYDGTEKSVALVGTEYLPAGFTVAYTGNKGINAGNYSATATISYDAVNNEIIGSAAFQLDWKINKRAVSLDGITWDYAADGITYDGTEKTVVLVGTELLPEGFTVEYTGNKGTNAGDYTAIATITYDTENNEIVGGGVLELDWKINRAHVDMSEIKLENTTVVYNGKAQLISLTGADKLPSGVTYAYDSEGYVYPGSYKITVKFTVNGNYYAIDDLTATLTIVTTLTNRHEHVQNGDVIISVDSQNGVGAEYDFVVKDKSHFYNGLYLENGQYAKVYVAYDIYFAKLGAYSEVRDNFTVKFLIPQALRSNANLGIVFIADDGSTEFINSACQDNYIIFSTSHFSTYAIVEITTPPTPPTETNLTWLWILLIVLGVLGIAALIIIIIVKRRKKNGGDEPDAPAPAPSTPDGEENAEESMAEEESAEEAPAQEAVVEEVPAQEAVVEEVPAEEATVEESPAEVVPIVVVPVEKVENQPKAHTIPDVSVVDDADNVKRNFVDGEVVLVRYRSSFQSRLIQSEDNIQGYYSVIKNTLLSYKGVKARTSWNYESFNKGRVQCVKLNIKGRTLIVNINLNPSEYNINKYHFTDMSDKPKFEQVPMMMKVRSDRALKYTVELIEEMMRKLEIHQGDVKNVDYRMPYETTEELAKRGLVKVILPKGMTLDENSNVLKLNVGELLNSSKKEEPTKEVKVDHSIHVIDEFQHIKLPLSLEGREVVHVDAVHADELISDEEAESSIEIIHTGKAKKDGVLYEINLDTICENFNDGDVVDLQSLQAKGLVPKKAERIKVLARGIMTKALTIVADKYSVQAVKMIDLAGGIAEIDE